VEEGGSESRRVSLRICVADAEVQVEVQDSGLGIADELHGSLFNTFISDWEDRLGMGLAICQRIIEAYGGRIGPKMPQQAGRCLYLHCRWINERGVRNE